MAKPPKYGWDLQDARMSTSCLIRDTLQQLLGQHGDQEGEKDEDDAMGTVQEVKSEIRD